MKSTSNEKYVTKAKLILARNKVLPALRNFYTTSYKSAGLIELKQNITIVVPLKETQYKIFSQLLDIGQKCKFSLQHSNPLSLLLVLGD